MLNSRPSNGRYDYTIRGPNFSKWIFLGRLAGIVYFLPKNEEYKVGRRSDNGKWTQNEFYGSYSMIRPVTPKKSSKLNYPSKHLTVLYTIIKHT